MFLSYSEANIKRLDDTDGRGDVYDELIVDLIRLSDYYEMLFAP